MTKAEALSRINLKDWSKTENIRFWQCNVKRYCIDGRICDDEIAAYIEQRYSDKGV